MKRRLFQVVFFIPWLVLAVPVTIIMPIYYIIKGEVSSLMEWHSGFME